MNAVNADNADNADSADSADSADNADNAEGVIDLSPGWRLRGTLGININRRAAL